MPSMQRRRGTTIRIYKTVEVTDNRGNKSRLPGDDYIETKAAWLPQRSSRAEVPGEAQINVVRLILAPDLEDVDLWSRIEALGKVWDIVTPPLHVVGTRHTKHWLVDIRERP